MDRVNDIHMTTQLFKTRVEAEKAYQEALDAGYVPEDINILMSENSRNQYVDSVLVKEGSKAGTGAGIGGATGAAVGGLVAALAAVGTSLIIPGLNLVVAGPLAAGLAGAGAGGIAGGTVGALVGWGIPEDKAKVFASGIESGGVVLSVNEHDPNTHLNEKWMHH